MVDVISGVYQPEPPLSPGNRFFRLLIWGRLGLYLLPWVLMSGGLILVGILALGPRRNDIPELWICLPAGLALATTLAGVPLWFWWRSPAWIQRFEYDGRIFSYAFNAGQPSRNRSLQEVASISEYHRRKQGLLGYRITFRDGTCILLSRQVTNADQLYAALRGAVGARETDG